MAMKFHLPMFPLLGLLLCGPASALEALADRCDAALEADDRAAFDAVVEAVRPRKDVFDIEVRKRVEACLSRGLGEPWEYSFPESAWLPVAEAQARQKARGDAARAEALSAADAEARRMENIKRVATMIYQSCSALLSRDQVAAMTNQLCVDTFLENGLPTE